MPSMLVSLSRCIKVDELAAVVMNTALSGSKKQIIENADLRTLRQAMLLKEAGRQHINNLTGGISNSCCNSAFLFAKSVIVMLLYPNWPVFPNTASEICLACCGKNGITFDIGLGMQKATALFATKVTLEQLSHNFPPPRFIVIPLSTTTPRQTTGQYKTSPAAVHRGCYCRI